MKAILALLAVAPAFAALMPMPPTVIPGAGALKIDSSFAVRSARIFRCPAGSRHAAIGRANFAADRHRNSRRKNRAYRSSAARADPNIQRSARMSRIKWMYRRKAPGSPPPQLAGRSARYGNICRVD